MKCCGVCLDRFLVLFCRLLFGVGNTGGSFVFGLGGTLKPWVLVVEQGERHRV